VDNVLSILEHNNKKKKQKASVCARPFFCWA
jgi:hypothetical protein